MHDTVYRNVYRADGWAGFDQAIEVGLFWELFPGNLQVLLVREGRSGSKVKFRTCLPVVKIAQFALCAQQKSCRPSSTQAEIKYRPVLNQQSTC